MPPTLPSASTLTLTMDLVGIFVFGLTGGTLAVRKRLDLFGVVVLAMATALAGGIVRDVLIGAVPPATFRDARYLWVAVASGFASFFFHRAIERLDKPVMLLDAAGLGLFAVSGCRTALAAGLDPLPAALIGMLTGCGGGILRDLLIAEVPRVLREEIYALAALAGSVIVIAGQALDAPAGPLAAVAATVTCVIRVVSVRRGWRAPLAPGS